MNMATIVVAEGKAARDSALLEVDTVDKVLACNHIVDSASIRDAVDQARRQRVSAHDPVGHRFLYVGQLIKRKNALSLVEGFASIAREGDELLLVGEGPQGETIRKAARDVTVGRVQLLGYKSGDDLWQLFSESHSLVLPSTIEVFGHVALEGLAADLNVVVSRTAGVAADISDRPNVYVCEPTIAGLAQGLAASRRGWRGPQRVPMEQFGVKQLEATVISACTRALHVAERYQTPWGTQ